MSQLSNCFEVAKTILRQIKTGVVPPKGDLISISGDYAMNCWGFDRAVATDYNGNNALGFRVNGAKHIGGVIVEYNRGLDTYNVHLIERNGATKESVQCVFADQLASVIDSLVEA